MIVVMFQPQFEGKIISGVKWHTIRPRGKRRLLVGREISLRVWTGKPYRSKQREFLKATISVLVPVCVHEKGVRRTDTGFELDRVWVAIRDGFDSWREMKEWFAKTHGLPFEGNLISWR
jgi:hypothetical protein